MGRADSFLAQDNERIAEQEKRRRCAEPGPWGTVCTDYPGHRYAHYDASDDSSWTDDWRDWN